MSEQQTAALPQASKELVERLRDGFARRDRLEAAAHIEALTAELAAAEANVEAATEVQNDATRALLKAEAELAAVRAERDRLRELIAEAALQIEYLHDKLGFETGSGNSVIAKLRAALAEERGT